MASDAPVIKFSVKISHDNRGRKLDEIWQQDYVWLALAQPAVGKNSLIGKRQRINQ